MPHDNEIEFQRGDVVIGNNEFGKYKNELQIVLKPHKDNRKISLGILIPTNFYCYHLLNLGQNLSLSVKNSITKK